MPRWLCSSKVAEVTGTAQSKSVWVVLVQVVALGCKKAVLAYLRLVGRRYSNAVLLHVQVVLTDCEEAVLLNLRECAAANAESRQEPKRCARAAAFPSQVRALKPLRILQTARVSYARATRVLNSGREGVSPFEKAALTELARSRAPEPCRRP